MKRISVLIMAVIFAAGIMPSGLARAGEEVQGEKLLPPGTTLVFKLLPQEEEPMILQCAGGKFSYTRTFQNEDESYTLAIDGSLTVSEGRILLRYNIQLSFAGQEDRHEVSVSGSAVMHMEKPMILAHIDGRAFEAVMLPHMPPPPEHPEDEEMEEEEDNHRDEDGKEEKRKPGIF